MPFGLNLGCISMESKYQTQGGGKVRNKPGIFEFIPIWLAYVLLFSKLLFSLFA